MIWDATGFKGMVKSAPEPCKINFDQTPKKVVKVHYDKGYVGWELYRA